MGKPRPGSQTRARFAADHEAAATNEQTSWWVNVIEGQKLPQARALWRAICRRVGTTRLDRPCETQLASTMSDDWPRFQIPARRHAFLRAT
jgi:hypothetical protein